MRILGKHVFFTFFFNAAFDEFPAPEASYTFDYCDKDYGCIISGQPSTKRTTGRILSVTFIWVRREICLLDYR